MKKTGTNPRSGLWIVLSVLSVGFLLMVWSGSIPSFAQDQKPAPAATAESKTGQPAPPAATEPKAEKPAAGTAQPQEVKEEAKPAVETKKPAANAPEAKPAVEPPKTDKEKPAAEENETESEEASGDLDNSSCMDCHNADILEMSKEELLENVEVGDKPAPPRKKPPFLFGDLSLAIDMKKYEAGVHAETTCVECHQGIEEIPHKQRLEQVNCAECHEDAVEAVKASAHGDKSKHPLSCIGCHDVHYSKGVSTHAAGWKGKYCIECHGKYGLDTVAAHKKLYEAKLHMDSLGCLSCHKGKEGEVHDIAPAKEMVINCESCHSKDTVLSEVEKKPVGFTQYIFSAKFINEDVLKKFGYVLGANRVPLLDLIVILLVIGPLALPFAHGGLRILCRRKGPIELPEEKIYLHPLLERIWHWVQALAIVMLIITGAIIHWPEVFSGWFEWGVSVHNWFGWLAVIAWSFWFLYNLLTGRITHYIPKKGEIPKGMIKQARFYGYGIFKHESHPYAPSEDNKFNPLQKIAYLQFQLFLFPLLLISGLLYMYPEYFKGIIEGIGGMTVLALIHYILAALFAAFLVAHLYLATTGETVSENFKAIITGYGIKEEHHEDDTRVV